MNHFICVNCIVMSILYVMLKVNIFVWICVLFEVFTRSQFDGDAQRKLQTNKIIKQRN